MGMFFSNCKSCGKVLSWFPVPPGDVPCRNCGTVMSVEEHIESYHEYYKRHIAEIIKSEFSSLPAHEISRKLGLNENFLAEVLEMISKESS